MCIVGGGISGLYSAMNLMSDPRTLDRGIKNIALLEGSDRFGGRFEADSVGVSGTFRFAYKDPDSDEKSAMPLLSQLVKDLGMHDDVTKSAAGQFTEDTVSYFGGNHITNLDVKLNPDVWKELFKLKDDEVIRSVLEADMLVYKKVLKHNQEKLEEKYPDRAAVILAQQDQTLLQQYQDPEFWSFFRNEFTWSVGSQEVPLRDLSMSTLVPLMDFSPGFCNLAGFCCLAGFDSSAGSYLQSQAIMRTMITDSHILAHGWPSLINKLEKQLLDLSGTNGIKIKLRRNCKVSSISFAKEEADPIHISFEDLEDCKTVNITADQIVMATPPPAVEKINLLLDGTKIGNPRCEAKMSSGEKTYIELYFKSAWWNKEGEKKMTGPCCSDLPSSVVIPFYSSCVESNCPGCDTCSDDPCPVGLTILCGRRHPEFWTSLQRLGNPYNVCAIKNPKLTPTSEAVVDVAMEQLKKIFRFEADPPRPVMATYRSLNKESKYGCPTYAWSAGLNDREFECCETVQGRKVYFCHDAWSDCQNWVEGALRSSRKVVEKMLEKMK